MAASWMSPLVLLAGAVCGAAVGPPAGGPTASPHQHLRFSSAYAWNASSLPSVAFNLAQARSAQAAAALARRGLPSAVAGFQGRVFIRSSSASPNQLAPDWSAQLQQLIAEMKPHVRRGAIEAAFLGDEICCHNPRCLNVTLAPVARQLRAHFPNPEELLIWTNECDSSIVGGLGHGGVVVIDDPPTPAQPFNMWRHCVSVSVRACPCVQVSRSAPPGRRFLRCLVCTAPSQPRSTY